MQKVGALAPFYQDGECATRESPFSTFKIALAIIGYNGGILQDTEHPILPFKEGYDDWLPAWRKEQSPKSWIQYSVVWYSKQITERLGKKFIVSELNRFDYGNKDFSDLPGKKGLTDAWLGGALKISPLEQERFLSHVAQGKFFNNAQDFSYLKDLLRQPQNISGWTIYGKTGSSGLTENPEPGKPYRISWFVGWLEKDQEKIIFINFQQQMSKKGTISGPLLRDAFFKKLPSLLKSTQNQ